MSARHRVFARARSVDFMSPTWQAVVGVVIGAFLGVLVLWP